jgi:ribose transport system permease protein
MKSKISIKRNFAFPYKSRIRGYETVVILAGLFVIFTLATSRFLTSQNFNNIALILAVPATMALGVLFPLIIGEFDLSLGYLLGFCMMFEAYVAQHTHNSLIVILVGPLTGLLIGLLNGYLTVFFKISSFIATLGVGIILNGGTQGLSNGQVLYQNIPKAVTTLAIRGSYFFTPATWISILFAIFLFYIFDHTPFGRHCYAIGGSQRVAHLAGIKTSQTRILAFGFCGLFVGFAANFALAQAGSASPSFGPDLLLPAYAAAFLGVTTFRPGYYNIFGTVVALVLLSVGFNGLSLLGVPFWIQPVFNGGVLIIAVLVARKEGRQVLT